MKKKIFASKSESKKLKLDKIVIADFDTKKVKGGGFTDWCVTNEANTCLTLTCYCGRTTACNNTFIC